MSRGSPAASNGTGTAPSQSEPSPTCSAPIDARPRGRSRGRSPPRRARRRPCPRSRCPPARRSRRSPRSWSSVRLRALSAVAADAGVRRDDGARGHARRTSSIVAADAWATSSDQAARLHLADQLAAERRQPALGDPCADPPNAVSKKCAGEIMRKPASTIASSVDEVGAQRVRALDREHARREARVGRPRLQVGREVLARADEPERAVGPGGQPVRPVREEQGARGQAPPGAGRPAGGDGHARHVVAAVVVALDVEVARRLHRGREHLEGDAALDHARHVEVATGPAHEQVAAEQQRVRVQVDRPDRRVEGQRTLGRVGRRGRDRVQAPLDAADQVIEHRAGGRQRRRPPRAPPATAIRRRALTRRTPGRGSGRIQSGML